MSFSPFHLNNRPSTRYSALEGLQESPHHPQGEGASLPHTPGPAPSQNGVNTSTSQGREDNTQPKVHLHPVNHLRATLTCLMFDIKQWKRWTFFDPYHTRISHDPHATEGWVESMRAMDHGMCTGWREQIDTLLIFVRTPTISHRNKANVVAGRSIFLIRNGVRC
jgi:hypothetical protein